MGVVDIRKQGDTEGIPGVTGYVPPSLYIYHSIKTASSFYHILEFCTQVGALLHLRVFHCRGGSRSPPTSISNQKTKWREKNGLA